MRGSTRFFALVMLAVMLTACGGPSGGVSDDTSFAAQAIDGLVAKGVMSKEEAADFKGADAMAAADFVRWLALAALDASLFASDGDTFTYNALANYVIDVLDWGGIAAMWGGIDICRTLKLIPADRPINATAAVTRAEAAYYLYGLLNALDNRAELLHGFYAIASYEQRAMIGALDGVSMGWSRMEVVDGQTRLNVTLDNDNEYSIPSGYAAPLTLAEQDAVPAYLMIAVQTEYTEGMTTSAYILTHEQARADALDALVEVAQNGVAAADGSVLRFSGLTLDFEALAGSEVRAAYSSFVAELRQRLPEGYGLLVCVHPARGNGRSYYNGYDFKALGDNSDGLIVMAHDYYAKSLSDSERAAGYTDTPLSPIGELYYALKAATDPTTGTDAKKVWLAVSFDSVQWQLKNGEVQNTYPLHPNYNAIAARLPEATITRGESGNPRAAWSVDGIDNVLYYEDRESVLQKQQLADVFGIAGLSLWRLGIVPDGDATLGMDVWDALGLTKD